MPHVVFTRMMGKNLQFVTEVDNCLASRVRTPYVGVVKQFPIKCLERLPVNPP